VAPVLIWSIHSITMPTYIHTSIRTGAKLTWQRTKRLVKRTTRRYFRALYLFLSCAVSRLRAR
jgi:hypothetical protein